MADDRLRTPPAVAANIAGLALSLEAIALRVRKSIGDPNAYRVLDWARGELDKLGAEANALADQTRDIERHTV